MQDQTYGAQSKSRKKGFRFTRKHLLRFALSALILLLTFIPTYIALFHYAANKDDPLSRRVTIYTEAQLFGPKGSEFSILPDASEEQRAALALLDALIARGERVSTVPPDFRGDYRLTMRSARGNENYVLYCNASSPLLYFADNNGNCYRAELEAAKAFLNNALSYELYENAAVPTLTTAATDVITPERVTWYYRTQNGSFSHRINTKTIQETLTYPIANDIRFSFSVRPTHYSIEVTHNAQTVIYNNTETFTTPQLTEEDRLDVVIRATFEQTETSGYYGTLTYRFRMNAVEPARFIPNQTEFSVGGFVVLTCRNVKNAQNLRISLTPEIAAAPIVFKIGDAVYAAIPLETSGKKTLAVTYGTISASFGLTVHDTAAATLDVGALDTAIINAAAERIAQANVGTPTGTMTPSGRFEGPALTAGVQRRVAFGDLLQANENGDTIALPFEIYDGLLDVKALSFGIVREVGEHPLLGKYVLLDHGQGLYSHYFGLSEIRVEAGAVVAIGQTIGIAGSALSAQRELTATLIAVSIGNTPIRADELRRAPYLPE